MPDGGFAEAAYAIAEFWAAYGTYVEIALAVAAAYQSYESSQRAKDSYNASLRDRYVMQRTSTGQRALVLGRARVSGPIAFMQSYGNNQSTLAIVVVFAAHECDAIEKLYFNDAPVIIDSNGNVVGVLNSENFSVSSSSPLTVFLAVAAKAGTITATATYADATVTLGTSLASDKTHLTLTGARAGQVGDVKVTYQPVICQYTPNQLVDQTYAVTASGATGTYTFPAGTTIFGEFAPRGVRSSFISGPVSTTSVVVVQVVGNVQTALPFTCDTNALGEATAVHWSGATTGASVHVTYQTADMFSRARVRLYLGAPGQAADPKLITNLPGEWTSNHIGTGLCYAVCEFDYDQSSFSAGLPNVSATVRGAKVYDPRIPGTVWTENPAILARGYWTHALGPNLPAAMVDDSACLAAANVCDNITSYFVGPTLLPRPSARYTAGYVATRDMKPQDVLTDLCMAMGGRWVITGNLLRLRAGAYTSPVAAIDSSWLSSESGITLQPLPARQTLFNAAQGTFADETNDHRAVPYPKVSAAPLITSDGRELLLDITYTGVTKTAQAQYLTACAIRYNRAGLTIRLACNMKAFPLEVFDVVTLTLPRFGFAAQTFEVTDTAFTADGGMMVTLKFTDPSIWAVDSSYSLTAYAPKTTLPSPWNVQVPILGTPLTGSSQVLLQADGTAVSRIYVPISMSDVSVITGGYIDVSYIDAADDLTSNWTTISMAGDAQGVYLAPVKDGHTYQIKARARNTLYASSWSPTVNALVIGQAGVPADVGSPAYQQGAGRVRFSWNGTVIPDYLTTEVRQGTSWATGTLVGSAPGTALDWVGPAHGSYTLWFAHQNRTRLYSAAPQSLTVTVDASIDVGLTALVYLYQRGSSAPTLPSAAITYTFATGGMTGITNGWSTSPPAGALPLYVAVASAVGPGATTSIAAASWSTPTVLAQNGLDGLNSATVLLFQRTSSSTPPSLPSATVTYTFATGAAAGMNNGWTLALPTTGGGFRWVTTAAAAATTSTDSIGPGEWSAAALLAQDGAGAFTMAGSTTMTINGPTVTKTSGGSTWGDAQIYSLQAYSGGAIATVTVPNATHSLMVALNSDPTTDASYTSLDYAVYLQGDSQFYVYESNVNVGNFGTYSGGDVFSVRYDNTAVYYAKNGTVFHTTAAAAGLTLFLDSSFYDVGASATVTYAPAGAAGAPGGTGAPGLSTAAVYAYQRSSSGAPALPSATTTYTFATGGLTGLNNGWASTIPGGTNALYVTVASASSSGATDTIASGEWAGAVLLAASGADGTAGLNSATVYLFQRTSTSSAPSLPSATVSYTFATGAASGVNNGWTQTLPTTGGAFRWVTLATAAGTGTADTIGSGEWAAAALLAQDGTNGTNGITATLTSDTYTLPADSTGHVSSYAGATTTMVVLNGGTDDSSNWTFSKVDSTGVTSTITSNAVTDTALADANDTGYIDITAARSGYSSITKRYSLTKSKSAVMASTLNQSIGTITATWSSSPHTIQANAAIRLGNDGYIYARQGNSTATYASTGTKFDNAGTFTGTYYAQYDILSQSGGAVLGGTGAKGVVKPSTNGTPVTLQVTNGTGDVTLVCTVYDSTGGNKLASFNVTLHVDSAD